MQIGTQTSSSEHKMKKCHAPPTFTCPRMQCHEAASYGCSIPLRKDFFDRKISHRAAEHPNPSRNFKLLVVRCGLFKALRVLMLCTPVFIFTSGSSAHLGRPRCGLSIWLPLLAIFNTPFWVYAFFINEKTAKTAKTKILEVRHFRMIRKWSPTVARRAKH